MDSGWQPRRSRRAHDCDSARHRGRLASQDLISQKAGAMSTVQQAQGVQSGLEGVVAFATEIAEPDKAGGALRYRGVDIEELVGVVPYEQVWGLLVDGHLLPGLPPAEPHPLSVRSGDP